MAISATFSHRHGQCFDVTPTSLQPVGDCPLFEAEKVRPLRQGLRLAVVSDEHVASSIIGLLFSRGPSAIAWLVMALIVDALDRVIFGRTMANVFHEQRYIQPSTANSNSDHPVGCKVWMVRLRAAANHLRPAWVSECLRQAVRAMSFNCAINKEASTTLGVSRRKRAGNHDNFLSAIAAAEPRRRLLFGVDLKSREASVFDSGSIFRCRHNGYCINDHIPCS